MHMSRYYILSGGIGGYTSFWRCPAVALSLALMYFPLYIYLSYISSLSSKYVYYIVLHARVRGFMQHPFRNLLSKKY